MFLKLADEVDMDKISDKVDMDEVLNKLKKIGNLDNLIELCPLIAKDTYN